jgi:hypothetical protein
MKTRQHHVGLPPAAAVPAQIRGHGRRFFTYGKRRVCSAGGGPHYGFVSWIRHAHLTRAECFQRGVSPRTSTRFELFSPKTRPYLTDASGH